MNGTLWLKLYKGRASVIGCWSDADSLHDANMATFKEGGGTYRQADATGFIRLNALRRREVVARLLPADELEGHGEADDGRRLRHDERQEKKAQRGQRRRLPRRRLEAAQGLLSEQAGRHSERNGAVRGTK